MGEVKSFTPKYQFSPENALFFGMLHAGALLALFPFAFSWSAVAVFFFMHWLTASLGICLGFHRYLTHRSFELPKWLGYFFAFCGTLACENGPIKWVAQHRMHHQYSDTDLDPHTPNRGFWWSHMGWMLFYSHYDDSNKIREYAKDLMKDPFYRFLDNHFIKIQVVFGLIMLSIGGLPWLVWGVFLRLVVVYHGTWFVNSASHIWGYRNFKLKDDLATNCWWVGLIAYGEGWHNNHHAFPSSARHGLLKNEIDMTWMVINLLKKLGLATHVKVVTMTPKADNEEGEAFFNGELVKQAA